MRIWKNIASKKTTSIVKASEFCKENTFKLQQIITNALGYKSYPSWNVVNLSKHLTFWYV